MVNILQHYSKEIVREEIYNFSKNRWVAFYSSGNFIHYNDRKCPLKFDSPEDVIRLVKRYNARTVYATAGKYQLDICPRKNLLHIPYIIIYICILLLELK